jgi:hypothetical protein
LLVDATLIWAAPEPEAAEGLADEGLAEGELDDEAFGFGELLDELPPPQAAMERRAAASTEVWTTRILSMSAA